MTWDPMGDEDLVLTPVSLGALEVSARQLDIWNWSADKCVNLFKKIRLKRHSKCLILVEIITLYMV